MATTTPYCTAQDVVDCCSWPAFAQLSAAAQSRFILAASRRIDLECRRPLGFAAQMVSETFSGHNRPALWLRTRPVITVAAVTVDGTALDNSDGSAWTVNPETGKLVRGSGRDDSRFAPWFPAGEQNIVVQYWGGYQDLPDDLVVATAFLVRYLRERGRTAGIYKSESIGDWSGTLNDAGTAGTLPSHVMDLIVDYVQDDAF